MLRFIGDKTRRFLVLILLAYLLLAAYYSVSIPLGEAPGELEHFNVVRFLTERRYLPEGTGTGSAGLEPPLYYIIGAAATAWIDVGDFQMRANMDFSPDRAETARNLLLHTKAEQFPYWGGVLAWHIIRFLSIIVGAVTVVATFLIGRAVFPSRSVVALGMAATLAFTPGFIFASSTVTNEILAAMFSSLLMLKLIRMHRGTAGWRSFAHLGTLLGLSLLSSSSAIALIPLVLMALFGTSTSKGLGFLQSLLWSAIAAVFAFGLSGWWFLRNQVLYDDLLGWGLKLELSPARSLPFDWPDFTGLVANVFQSYWGRFGGASHLRFDWPIYAALGFLVLLSSVGCLVALRRVVRNRRLNEYPSTVQMVIGALNIALALTVLFRWNITFRDAGRASLLYPALGSLILFLVVGLLKLIPARAHRLSISGLGLALFAISAATPFMYFGPVYQLPQTLTTVDIPNPRYQTSYDFGGARLVGYEFDRDSYEPGETARLILYWQTLGGFAEDQRLQIQLVSRTGQVVFQKEGCPSGGSYSADLWGVGEIVRSTHFLRLNPRVQPGGYQLRLAMRPVSREAWMPVFDRLSGRVDNNATVGSIIMAAKAKPPGGVEQPVKAYLVR